jgi:glutamate-1-semialdehyde 2,1-aminomutase
VTSASAEHALGTLPAPDARGAALLAAGNPMLRRVLAQVAARQRTSVRLHRRALRSVSALPSQLPYAAALLPLCVREAEGSRIVDVDGNEYIDCHMAYTAAILGHRPPAVVAAVQDALGQGLGAGHFCEAQLELAELVQRMVPGLERVALLHSGADAVAASVRLARAATGRSLVAKFEGCYHGWSELGLYNPTLVLAGRAATDPLDRIRPRAATGGVSAALGAELLILPFGSAVAFELIRARAAELACVLADPIPPFASPHPETARAFVRELRAVTAEAGVPLVLDEVVSGFRLARGGAQEAFGLSAEVAAYGKVTSALGIPLSIVGGRGAQLDHARTDGLFADYRAGKAWTTTTHAGGHPAVAAALAQLRLLDADFERIIGVLDRNHARLAAGVRAVARETGIPVALVGHPRLQSHLMVGEPAAPAPSYRAAMATAGPEDFRRLLALTFYLRLEGVYAKAVPTMNLSLAHTDEDVDRIVEAIRRSVVRMRADGVLGAKAAA